MLPFFYDFVAEARSMRNIGVTEIFSEEQQKLPEFLALDNLDRLHEVSNKSKCTGDERHHTWSSATMKVIRRL